MKKLTRGGTAAVLFAALLFASCEQGSGPVSYSVEQDDEDDWTDGTWEPPEEEPPPEPVGFTIAALPDITYYPLGGEFSTAGLKLAEVYSDGSVKPVPAGNYMLSPSVPNMASAGNKKITVSYGSYPAAYFFVYVDNSDVIPTGIRIVTPPKTEYFFGDSFDTDNMVINGIYSDNSEKQVSNSMVSIEGYDSYRRGEQKVTLRLNAGKAEVDVRVKIGKDDKVELTGNTVYLRDKDFDLANSNLKAVVTRGNISVPLTAANGGLLLSDITEYDKTKTEGQYLRLTLDDKSVRLGVFVVEAEPDVWFDFGYIRQGGPENGAGPGEGKFYTAPNKPLVLAPVRYLIGYNDDHSPASGVTYNWSVTVPNGGAYDTAAAKNKETFAFKPSVAGIYTVTVNVTGRDFITGGTIERSASVTVVCHTGKVATARTFTSPLRNFAPGQFVESGTGYGWSLGTIGGYAVWDAEQHQDRYFIAGNSFYGWTESGIVWVQEDNNGNGLPDEMWYEIKGGDDGLAYMKPLITRRYAVTFMKFGSGAGTVNQYGQTISGGIYWADCRGRAGYYPSGWPSKWGITGSRVTYTGTLLRDTGVIYDGATSGVTGNDLTGYVDTATHLFYLANAIDAAGNSVTLTNVRFLKVQTAIFRYGGGLGEVSTEITNADGFYNRALRDFPKP